MTVLSRHQKKSILNKKLDNINITIAKSIISICNCELNDAINCINVKK